MFVLSIPVSRRVRWNQELLSFSGEHICNWFAIIGCSYCVRVTSSVRTRWSWRFFPVNNLWFLALRCSPDSVWTSLFPCASALGRLGRNWMYGEQVSGQSFTYFLCVSVWIWGWRARRVVSEMRNFKNFYFLYSGLSCITLVLHSGSLFQVKMEALQNKWSAGT